VRSNNLDNLDLDDEEDVGTISAKSDETAKFTFDIKDDTDDATYTVTVKVTGTDQNGAKHGEVKTVRFKVNRETHELSFKHLEAVPPTVECDGSRIVTVDATIANIGKHDEDHMAIEADVPQLKFSKKITDIKLNKGKTRTVQFPIDVPADAKAGNYHADLITFFENTVKSNTKSVNFNVADCTVPEETPVATPPAVTPQPTPAPQPQPMPTPAPAPKVRVSSTSSSFTDSEMYVYVLAAASGFLLLLLIVTVVALASRRRRDDDD